MTQGLATARARGPHPLLYAALALGLLFHAVLLVSGSYAGTYDAWIHIFFADHYARGWFESWEPRWYTGFTITSYPPGGHMLIALLSGLVGLQYAFIIVQLFALALLTIGIYRFASLWVDPRAAGLAALIGVLGTAIAETVHVFGQLPTTLSLAFLLNTLPFIKDWLASGSRMALLTAVAGLAATTAAHHVTTIFGSVFFAGPVVLAVAIAAFRTPLADEPDGHPARVGLRQLGALVARRLRRVMPVFVRAGILAVGAGIVLITTVLAYWLWTSSDPIRQIPIPHASRDSFIENLDAGLTFFVIPWGVLLLVLPYVLTRAFAPRVWPLALSVLLLAVLGTGGTTPVPRLLLRGAFDILTLDRFTFWATIAILPFAGALAWSLIGGGAARAIRTQLGPGSLTVARSAILVGALLLTLFASTLGSFIPMQPRAIDPEPIADFMAKDQHWQYRYLTLGFGDQVAWVSANTEAQTVDGNYHSARRLPKLTRTSVERLDGAKFRGLSGLGSLQRFLAEPERYRLKFVFSDDRFYDPLLAFMGWHRIGRLENDVEVWERADIPPLPEVLPERPIPAWQSLLWGTAPPFAIASALALFGLAAIRSVPGQRLAWELGSSVARLGWPFSGLDRFLARRSTSLGQAGEGIEAWQFWHGWRERLPRPPRPSVRQRTVRGIALGLLGAGLVAVVLISQTGQARGPAQTVADYYDALDTHDFARAWSLLDPMTRPSFELYRLERSVRGGLLGSSYAKLDELAIDELASADGRAVFEVTAHWMTALRSFERVERHRLVEAGGAWSIVAPLQQEAEPRETVIAREEIGWLRQGRRSLSEDGTAWADVLDRPDLEVHTARLVIEPGRVSIVGELQNRSTLPADVTVSGKAFDVAGELVGSGNAGVGMVHTLPPGARSPFRVDLIDVAADDPAAPEIIEFDPDAPFSSVLAGADIATAAVEARAVVTDLDVHHDLGIDDVHVVATDGGCRVDVSVRALGVAEITVPQLLVARYDRDGRLAGVSDHYGPYGIRPGRVGTISLELPAVSALGSPEIPVGVVVHGREIDLSAASVPPALVDLPDGCGSGALAVTPNAYRAGA